MIYEIGGGTLPPKERGPEQAAATPQSHTRQGSFVKSLRAVFGFEKKQKDGADFGPNNPISAILNDAAQKTQGNRFEAIVENSAQYPGKTEKAEAIAALFRAGVQDEYQAYITSLHDRRRQFAHELINSGSSTVPLSALHEVMETMKAVASPDFLNDFGKAQEVLDAIAAQLTKMDTMQQESIRNMTSLRDRNGALVDVFGILAAGETLVTAGASSPSGGDVPRTLKDLRTNASRLDTLITTAGTQLDQIRALQDGMPFLKDKFEAAFNANKAVRETAARKDAFMNDLDGNGVGTRRKVTAPKTARFRSPSGAA